MPSDEDLARAFARGEDGAFEALVYRYHRALSAYFQRQLGGEEGVEDLVQETFLRFVRQVRERGVPDRVRPWLYRVATNLCRDRWRTAARRHERGEEPPDGWSERAEARPSVAEISDRLQARAAIVQALRELSERQRQMVILRFYHDLTYREIAGVLDLPEGTVKASLFRALGRLRERMDGPGGRARSQAPDEAPDASLPKRGGHLAHGEI
ncbi:MAG: RNA polymerase sigma factor [Bacillota bacterium]|nr:RNA polymerase sigma factor [Bacillota bacterium]